MSDDRFAELADRMRAEAAALSSATLWATAAQTVQALPLTPSEVQIKNSNSVTECWKHGGFPWHHH